MMNPRRWLAVTACTAVLLLGAAPALAARQPARTAAVTTTAAKVCLNTPTSRGGLWSVVAYNANGKRVDTFRTRYVGQAWMYIEDVYPDVPLGYAC